MKSLKLSSLLTTAQDRKLGTPLPTTLADLPHRSPFPIDSSNFVKDAFSTGHGMWIGG